MALRSWKRVKGGPGGSGRVTKDGFAGTESGFPELNGLSTIDSKQSYQKKKKKKRLWTKDLLTYIEKYIYNNNLYHSFPRT